MRSTLLALATLALPLAGQAAGRYTVTGRTVAVYNLLGTVRVEAASGSAVTVAVKPAGADAGKLSVQQGTIDERETLRVIYPDDDLVYPALGRGSSSTVQVRDDGTWGSYRNERRDTGHKVTIRGSGRGLEAWADLTIGVPAGQRVAIFLGAGRITAENVNGDVRLDTQSGDVEARQMQGALNIDTGSGDVTLTGARGDVNLDTGSGDVTVSDVSGGELVIDTGSGDVDAREVNATRLSLDTGSGEVRLASARSPRTDIDTGSGSVRVDLAGTIERIHIETGSGDVQLTLPEDVSAMLDLETGSGDFDVGMPVTLVHKEDGELRGRLGSGSGRIEIDTGSGDITLRR